LERDHVHSLRARLEVLAGPHGDGLPEIVRKAQEDARSRIALAQLGYSKVRAEYARHRREGRETFLGLENELLWPTTEFVGDWLKTQRRRILSRLRWPFIGTMLITIGVGIGSLWVMRLLQ
jgi:hypothetical protein